MLDFKCVLWLPNNQLLDWNPVSGEAAHHLPGNEKHVDVFEANTHFKGIAFILRFWLFIF